MNSNFPRILSLLRKEKGISQKKAAASLGVSQSLLSHYEKGIRECGLSFVLKVAEFYDVSCDYLLGKTANRQGNIISVENLNIKQEDEKKDLNSKAFKLIYKKKILFCSLNILIEYIKKTDSSAIMEEIFSFFNFAVYRAFRILFRINKNNNNEMFEINNSIANQLAQAEMLKAEATANFNAKNKFKNNENILKELLISPKILEKNFPQNSNALLNLIKNCETTILNQQ